MCTKPFISIDEQIELKLVSGTHTMKKTHKKHCFITQNSAFHAYSFFNPLSFSL